MLRTLLPGLFGGPWTVEGAGNTIYPLTGPVLQALFVALTALVVVASVRRTGRAAWGGWLLIVGYVAADVVLVLLGRGAYLLLVARDPRYVTDALPIIVIGVCAAFLGGRAGADPRPATPAAPTAAAAGARLRRARTLLPWSVVAVLIVSGLVGTLRLAPTTQHPQSEAYVRTVTAALADDPGASVLTTPVPAEVAISVNLESLLRAVGREQRLDRPGAAPEQVDGDGSLVPAALLDIDVDVTGPEPDCGWSLDGTPRPIARLSRLDEQQRLLRLAYLAASDGVLHVSVDGLEQAVEIEQGLDERYVVVTEQAGPVEAWVSDTSAGVCLASLQRGVAVAAP